MINLLSIETKQEFRAARLNVTLMRYVWLIAGAIVFLAVVFGVGYFITSLERAAAQSELEKNKQEAVTYSKTQQEAEAFTKNLAVAKTILNNEITYSSFLTTLAANLPSGTILSDFTADNTALTSGKPIVLNAEAKSYDAALKLKTTLEASPLFEQVNIANIEKKPNAPGQPDPTYPYIVRVNVTVSKNGLQATKESK